LVGAYNEDKDAIGNAPLTDAGAIYLYTDGQAPSSIDQFSSTDPIHNTRILVSADGRQISIGIDPNLPAKRLVTVYDRAGRSVYMQRVNASSNSFNLNVTPGLYIIKLHSGSEIETIKVIVQ